MKQYYILTIETKPENVDEWSAWIEEQFNVSAIEIEKVIQRKTWLELYFEGEDEALLAGQLFQNQFAHTGWAVRCCEDRDWMEFWRSHFHPRLIGEKIWVHAPWHDLADAPSEAITLEINPGLSFGTGNHFTTSFCIEVLQELLKEIPGASLADLGAGSGILSIAAAKLGAIDILAIENDALAIEQSKENLMANKVSEQIRYEGLDLFETWFPEQYDIVVANIYGHVLVQLAPQLVSSTKNYLVLSGIRVMEGEMVSQAFCDLGMKEVLQRSDHEWCGLILKK